MTTSLATSQELPIINYKYKSIVTEAAIATGIALASLLTPYEAIKIIGMTVLTGVGYGITNDMFACRDCIEYFTIGHHYDKKKLRYRPLNTLNPTLNAIAWGAIATWHVCAIAGTAFALLARMPFWGLAIKITAIQLAPYLTIGAAIALIISHVRSKVAQKKMADNPYLKYLEVPINMQSKWEACNIRNTTGYASIGIGGALLSIVMIAARAGLFIL